MPRKGHQPGDLSQAASALQAPEPSVEGVCDPASCLHPCGAAGQPCSCPGLALLTFQGTLRGAQACDSDDDRRAARRSGGRHVETGGKGEQGLCKGRVWCLGSGPACSSPCRRRTSAPEGHPAEPVEPVLRGRAEGRR